MTVSRCPRCGEYAEYGARLCTRCGEAYVSRWVKPSRARQPWLVGLCCAIGLGALGYTLVASGIVPLGSAEPSVTEPAVAQPVKRYWHASSAAPTGLTQRTMPKNGPTAPKMVAPPVRDGIHSVPAVPTPEPTLAGSKGRASNETARVQPEAYN